MSGLVELITEVLDAELDEHGTEDDDEKRRQVAHHWAEKVAAELNLTEEWANSWEQQGDLDAWYPHMTGGGSREIAEVNMAMDRNTYNPRFRNMKLLRRWVSGWVVVEPPNQPRRARDRGSLLPPLRIRPTRRA